MKIQTGINSLKLNEIKHIELKQIKLRHIEILSFFIFLIFLIFSVSRIRSFAQDETVFHYPNMINFYENGLKATFNSQYSAANTPLPYIIVSLVAKLSLPNLLVARIVTAIISLLTFFTAMKLLTSLHTSKYCHLVLLFFPYFFMNSFIFYAVNYGLLFSMLALLFYYKSKDKLSVSTNFITGSLISLAVLSQQFYLLLPVAMAIPAFIIFLRDYSTNKDSSFGRMVLGRLVLFLPLVVPFYIFFNWEGLTHPHFKSFSFSFHLSILVAVLSVVGFYLSPFVLQLFKQLSKWEILLLIGISIILVLLFKPTFSVDTQGPGLFTGITFHLISVAGKIHPALTLLSMIGLTSAGLLVFVKLFSSLSSEFEYTVYIACILLVFFYTCSNEIGERHLLPLMMLLFLLVLPRIKKPYTVIFPGFMAMMGMGYFFYWFLIKYAS